MMSLHFPQLFNHGLYRTHSKGLSGYIKYTAEFKKIKSTPHHYPERRAEVQQTHSELFPISVSEPKIFTHLITQAFQLGFLGDESFDLK